MLIKILSYVAVSLVSMAFGVFLAYLYFVMVIVAGDDRGVGAPATMPALPLSSIGQS
jgi:hypothetical protein